MKTLVSVHIPSHLHQSADSPSSPTIFKDLLIPLSGLIWTWALIMYATYTRSVFDIFCKCMIMRFENI